MQRLLQLAVAIYIIFYAFESPIRYVFHLVGADPLILLRDVLLILPLIGIFLLQLVRRQLHPAFLIYIGIVLLHGCVIFFNMGNLMVVAYCSKILMAVLIGAICAQFLLNPSRQMLLLLLFIWSANWTGIMLDKYFVEYPWIGMHAVVGDVEVDLSRDWQITGEDKRAGGFARSSINAATIEPLLALVLIFTFRSIPLRLGIAFLTIPALYWTTQKGSLLAYLITLALIALYPKRPIGFLRLGLVCVIALSVGLPVLLSGITMPDTAGTFSLSSFYLRMDTTWPHAWTWIHAHEIFPFGVGLGGIGWAQRFYAPMDINAADNIFIMFYAYFGMMSLVYLGIIIAMAMKVKNDGGPAVTASMAILVFLFGYGCVVTFLEDQMASLFLGAALGCMAHQIRSRQPVIPVPYITGQKHAEKEFA